RFDKFSLRGPGTQSWEILRVAIGGPEGRVRYARPLLGDVRACIPIEPSPYHLHLSDAGPELSKTLDAIWTSHGETSVEQSAHTGVALTSIWGSGASSLAGLTADGKSRFPRKRVFDDS